MRIIKSSKKDIEESIEEVGFKINKFNARVRPSKKDTVIFSCFSEFGTEILGSVYCIPILMNRLRGKYSIVMGWKGRSFLYRHLVDEFWEIDEKHMWLRKYCRAFHHHSRNLSKIEERASQEGTLIGAAEMGNVAVFPTLSICPACGKSIRQTKAAQICRSCNASFWVPGLFEDVNNSKKKAVWPFVSDEKRLAMSKYLKPNSVGITARNRSCYGRNLPPIFYERLIYLLEDMGYNPVWLGEQTSIHPCPFDRIFDFSKMPESDDLECTLGLVSNLKFTIQFWTASTRLAGMVGTPYILFESPDQILGGAGSPGHEGLRLNLCTRGQSKIVLAHFNDIAENHETAYKFIKRSVREIEVENYSDIFDMVDQSYWGERIWKN